MEKEFDKDTLEALEEQGVADVPADEDKPEDKPVENPEDDIKLDLGDEPVTENTDNKSVDKQLRDAGFDVETISKRIVENNGEIPEDIIKEAKEKFDPDLVDAHVARLKSEFKLAQIESSQAYKDYQEQSKKIQEMNTYIYDAVGGEDKFKSLASTLRDNLDKDTLESVNAKLLSGNKTLVNEALKTAVAEYKKAKGYGGERMEGDANAPSDKPMVITKEDYRAIMRTEKYKTDPVYRNKIDDARLKTRQADQKRFLPGTYFASGPNGRYEL